MKQDGKNYQLEFTFDFENTGKEKEINMTTKTTKTTKAATTKKTAAKTTAKKTATKKATAKKATATKKSTTAKAANRATKDKAKVIDMKTKREVGMKMDAIEALVNAGFKRWQKGGYDRLYISAAKLGLMMDENGATFMGDPIDQKEGMRMKAAKTYIDVKTGEVFSGHETLESAAGALISKVLSINEAVAI